MISNEEMHALNREHAFSTPVLDRWANLLFFPVISSVWLYSDRKPRACQKLGNSPGVGKCPVPGQRKICKCPTPWTKKAGKCPAVARRREGGGGRELGAARNDWCMTPDLPWNFHFAYDKILLIFEVVLYEILLSLVFLLQKYVELCGCHYPLLSRHHICPQSCVHH